MRVRMHGFNFPERHVSIMEEWNYRGISIRKLLARPNQVDGFQLLASELPNAALI
jgi:hypothetical protein